MEAFFTKPVERINMKVKHLHSFQNANKISTNALATMQNKMYKGDRTYLQ